MTAAGSRTLYAGVDAGGTSTRVWLADEGLRELARAAAGPGNVRHCGPGVAARTIAAAVDEALARAGRARSDVARLACGVAGAAAPDLRAAVEERLAALFPGAEAFVVSDAEAALAGVAGDPLHAPAIALLAGTGAIVLGRGSAGNVARAGGHGFLLGDEGSATWIGRLALAAALKDRDDRGPGTALTARLLPDGDRSRDALLDELDRALDGGGAAAVVARLGSAFSSVIDAARSGDVLATELLRRAGEELGAAALAVATKLGLADASALPVGYGGGAFAAGDLLLEPLRESLAADAPGILLAPFHRPAEQAVVHLALARRGAAHAPSRRSARDRGPDAAQLAGATSPASAASQAPASDLLAWLARFHAGDAAAVASVAPALPDVARAAACIAERFARGGRWFLAGAGTSGRLALLDAAELPPTFGVDPERVVALLAGGDDAIHRAVEGAEDDAGAGAAGLVRRGLCENDVVLGVSASGTTPYVLGALHFARTRGAATVALVCRAGSPIAAAADVAIVADVGPEAVAGSTRMKAGTAQKIVLHALSTAALAACGLVVRGEMVAMRPTNAKLRARAADVVQRVLGATPQRAREQLERAAWNLPVALVMERHGVGADEARERLARCGGDVARALDMAGQAFTAPDGMPLR